jgi:hypothetical protein
MALYGLASHNDSELLLMSPLLSTLDPDCVLVTVAQLKQPHPRRLSPKPFHFEQEDYYMHVWKATLLVLNSQDITFKLLKNRLVNVF